MSAIWGSSFFVIKISVLDINPISVASLRLIIAAILLFIYFKYKGYKFVFTFNYFILIFIIGLVGNFIPFSLISWSEQYIKSNTAGLLLSIAPFFALIFSHFLTKDDKFTFRKLISIIIGLVGISFIFGLDSIINISQINSNFLLPKIAIIISALGYVISSILAYNLKNINIVILTTYVTIFAAITSIPFLILMEMKSSSTFNFSSILSVIYLGIFPTAIAFLLRFHLISKAGPIFLSYVAYLIPVFAIIWGYIFLNEIITLDTFIGVILVLIGVFIGGNSNGYKN